MYFYLKEPKSIKPTLIYLIYHLKSERKNFKYSTGQKILPSDWDSNSRYPKLKRGGAGKKSKQISLVLDNYKDLLDDTIAHYEIKNKNLLKEELKLIFDKEFKYKDASLDIELSQIISEAIQSFIDSKQQNGAVTKNWKIKYTNLMKKIILFDDYRNRVTVFKDFNSSWLDAYCGFLRDFPRLVNKEKARSIKTKVGKVGYNDNSLQRHIVFLFTFLTWVKENYKIEIPNLKNPVKGYDTDDIHLTEEEVQKLENVRLKEERLESVRDIFLIGVYSGQRFSDYSIFEQADVKNDMIIKKSQKTVVESFVPLHDKLKSLLDKYDWKIPEISGQKFNSYIKEVCEQAEINAKVKKTTYRGISKVVRYYNKWELVSSHTARRTFITLSSEKGMPDHIIMKIVGIKKADTLLKYKKTNQDTVKDFMTKMWV